MKYFRYVLKKLLGMIPIILIVSAVVFFLLRMSGVDPVTVMIGEKQATDELRESLKTQLTLTSRFLLSTGYGSKEFLRETLELTT